MMNTNQSILKLVIIIVLLGLIIIIPIEFFRQSIGPEPPVHAGYPAPGTDVVDSVLPTETEVIPEVQQILAYQEVLKKDTLSDEMRKSLKNKIEILSRVATQIAIAQKNTPVPWTMTLDNRPTATRPTGLREGGTSDFHAWEAVIQNIWSQYANNNEHVTVYAGEIGSEMKYPGRGAVFVLRYPADSSHGGSFNQYLLPEGTGWVRISKIEGDTLILTSKEGETFYFYLPAQQFVSALEETAPTVTPLPKPPPPPTDGPPPSPRPAVEPSPPYP